MPPSSSGLTGTAPFCSSAGCSSAPHTLLKCCLLQESEPVKRCDVPHTGAEHGHVGQLADPVRARALPDRWARHELCLPQHQCAGAGRRALLYSDSARQQDVRSELLLQWCRASSSSAPCALQLSCIPAVAVPGHRTRLSQLALSFEGLKLALEHCLSAQVPAVQSTNQTAWTESGSSPGLDENLAVGGSLCDNLYNEPCGTQIVKSDPLSFIKFQVPACLPACVW